MRLPLIWATSVVYFGLTFVQLHNQMADQAVTSKPRINYESRIRKNFRNLFSSMTTNDTKNSKIYHEILREDARRERSTFDTMKEEMRIGRSRKAYQTSNFFNVDVNDILTVKREIKKKNRTTGKKAKAKSKSTGKTKTEIKCPYTEGGETPDKKSEFTDWEFYYDKNAPSENETSGNDTYTTMAGLTFLDMGNGSVTPPYDAEEDMTARNDYSREEDTEYLQSEWRQNWTRKNDDERFEEALQHASRPLLVNWYQHGMEQWADLEEMKKHAARNNCEHSVLSEPIEVVEIRLNKALRTIAKYIAKFDYGEATGKKTMS